MKALPKRVGAEVVNFALDNFKRQGFLDVGVTRWQKRKNPTAWGTRPKRNNRPILVDTGRLRRSIRVINANSDTVVVGTSVPYARAHNEGFTGKVTQRVRAFNRVQTMAGIAGKFGKGREFTTGAVTNLTWANGGISKKRAGRKKVQIEVSVRAHQRVINMYMPKRQFLGRSEWLNNRIKKRIAVDIGRALQLSKP